MILVISGVTAETTCSGTLVEDDEKPKLGGCEVVAIILSNPPNSSSLRN